VDVLGLVWYTHAEQDFNGNEGSRPALYKTTQPPLNDSNFRSISANTATKVCFAHIRAATATATTPVNNHPFVFGRHSFMHNGFISDFLAVKRDMCLLMHDDAYANISGSTDSEHVAALYMTFLVGDRGKAGFEQRYETKQMNAALEETVRAIIELQKKKLGDQAQPSSMNFATTDGSRLLAYRFRNHEQSQPPSLYYSTKAGVTLNRKYPDHPDGKSNPRAHKNAKEHGRHVIVASEPSTYIEKDWTLMEKNQSLMVESDGTIHLSKVDYPRDYTINDP